MQIKVRYDSDFDQRIDRMISGVPVAIARALNRSIDSVKVAVSRPIAADMGLKVSDVKERISVRYATPELQHATLYASAKRIALVDFSARGPVPSRGRGSGVSARLPGGKGRYPNAFIATMRSGHKGVFQRTGKKRLPIYELHGPSIVQVFKKYESVGKARGDEQLRKNLQSELRFAMRKAA